MFLLNNRVLVVKNPSEFLGAVATVEQVDDLTNGHQWIYATVAPYEPNRALPNGTLVGEGCWFRDDEVVAL